MLFIGAIQGCATMNKSECLGADWRIVGLEDGSAGKPLANIGRHREACAEHEVNPVLDHYKQGHSEGVRRFCTPHKGFQVGLRGRGHSDVCPADLRNEFIVAYEDGLELHAVRSAAARARNRMKTVKKKLDHLDKSITRLEIILISGEGNANSRINWLLKMKDAQSQRDQLEEELSELEIEIVSLQDESDYLSSKFQY